jgi:hypothetical protein
MFIASPKNNDKDLSVTNFTKLSLSIAAATMLTIGSAGAVQMTKPHVSMELPVITVSAEKHKMRSAGFIKTALEKKGVTVTSMRREGQVYLLLIEDAGSTAIVAVDGYSSEIIGINVLTYPAGATERAANSAGTHFVDFTYEFGYIVEETTYESYTEVTSEEYASTEEYTEVTYDSSEEVSYEDVTYDENTTEEDSADLDQGTADDEAGDAEADIQDNADEPADEGSSDEEG